MPRDRTEMITTLKPDEIFVFGSNTSGRHGRGAARQAYYDFGAEYGTGEGLTGQCYALPTLNGIYAQRTEIELIESIRAFYRCAADNPKLTFLLTKVGTGLAGFDEQTMMRLFHAPVLFLCAAVPPPNIVWPEGWR